MLIPYENDEPNSQLTLHDVHNILLFGSLMLPEETLLNHVLLIGTPGSGKTTLLRILIRLPFHAIGTGCDRRAIVFDVKQDMVSILAGIAPRADIAIMSPFDDRSCSWDLWRDINSPELAVEFAFTLIPKEPESNPFFADAVRVLVYSITVSFMLSGIEWTLADLLRVLKSRQLIKAVLQKHDETRDVVDEFFYDDKLSSSILSEAKTKFLAFEPIAAAWDHARRKVSLEEWSRSEMILVLGTSHRSRTPSQVLNRCLFKRSVEITLDAPESTTRRNYFVLDEFSSLGKLDGLVDLAKEGRSKGSCLIVAVQTVDGLSDPQLYGPNFSEEILAQLGTKFVGRVESANSADWASKLVGDSEVEQLTTSATSGSSQGSSWTTTNVNIDKRYILPSEIMSFPPCNYTNGLTGLFFVPSIGVFEDSIPGPLLFDELLFPPDATVPNFVPRPTACQFLRRWTPERAADFGIQELNHKPKQQPTLSEHDRDKLRDLDDLFQ